MPSTAISAQGSTVSIGTTTGSALTITAVSLTNPCRVTLSAVTALNKGDVITIAGVVGTTQLNGNSFVVQYIEPTTKIVTLAGLDATGYTTYTSGGTWARPIQHHTTNMYRRVYWSEADGNFYLVADKISGTSTTVAGNTKPGSQLPSTNWDMLPPDAKGLVLMSNGIAAAFRGKEILLSEPFRLHAWPIPYRQASNFDVVALGSFGHTLVVGTKGNPYTLSGIEPSTMGGGLARIDAVWPCLSERGMVSFGTFCLYPSPVGMIYVGPDGARVFTADLFTQDEFALEKPTTFVSALRDTEYVALQTIDAVTMRVLRIDRNEGAAVQWASVSADGIWTDPTDGLLYIVKAGSVYQWDAAPDERLVYDWMSKEFILPGPSPLGAAKIDANFFQDPATIAALSVLAANVTAANQALIDSGSTNDELALQPLGGDYAIGGDDLADVPAPRFDQLSISFYENRVLKHTETLTDARAFRLPDGFRPDVLSVRIAGTVPVKSLTVAKTMKQLALA